MKSVVVAGLVSIGALVSACAYNAPVTVSPNLDVYSSYGDKLPGSYALYIEDADFARTVHPTGSNCSAHTFPIDMSAAFRESTIRTIRELVDEVDVVQSPMSSDELAKAGKRGQIIVRADSMDARVQFIPGFWTPTAEADIDLTAALSVDSAQGRLLGTTAEGEGHAQGQAGGFCGGGAQVMADAAEKATKKLLGEMGERLSNSPRLRASATTQQPYVPVQGGEAASPSAQPASAAPHPVASSASSPASQCQATGLHAQDPQALHCRR